MLHVPLRHFIGAKVAKKPDTAQPHKQRIMIIMQWFLGEAIRLIGLIRADRAYRPNRPNRADRPR